MLLKDVPLQNKIKNLLNFLFPYVCPGCGDVMYDDKLFCDKCFSLLEKINFPFCDICGRPFVIKEDTNHICGKCLQKRPFFTTCRSVFVYNEPVKNAIIQFKFQNNTALAPSFVKEILLHLEDFIKGIRPDLVMPVPLHIKRLRERGYNQSLLLAQGIAKKMSIPCAVDILKKIKSTRPQVGLTFAQRQENVHRSFSVENPEQVKNRRILLIDDVFTTGSTVNECAKMLLKAKAEAVCVVTLARTVDAL